MFMKNMEILLIMSLGAFAMISCQKTNNEMKTENPQFVIEREIPGAGNLTALELKEGSKKSCEVLRELGPEIQWLHSYVTADKIYCVYTAPSKELIIEHAQRVGVPANQISEVKSVASPATAN
jgi:hypothetical protein